MYNSHTHTKNSHDGKAKIEDLCKEAEKHSLIGFAVTDHCDISYLNEPWVMEGISGSVKDAIWAKENFSDKLFVGMGVEIGETIFNPVAADKIIQGNCWDVVLSSVHLVSNMPWDVPFSQIDFSKADKDIIDKFLTQYFADMLNMIEVTDFDILCHLTVPLRYIVKKYKKAVDEEKYYPVITDILKEIIKRDISLEINTSGFITRENYFMPDEAIIDIYKSSGGKRVSLGSDAHNSSALTDGLQQGAIMLKNFGFNKATYYKNRKAIEYNL